MRFVARIVVALLLLAGAARAAKTGALEVESTTDGAEVFVDGERVGRVPLGGPVPLAPGEHTIKVTRLGFAPFIDVFSVKQRKPTHLSVELVPLSGVLRVSSGVEKARVFVDGKFVGEAPLAVEIEVGARAVQVSKGGYKDFFQNVSSVAGQEVALDVKLDELPVGVNPYKPAPPPPPKWYEKWWVWTVGGVGIAVLATAIAVPIALSSADKVKDFGAKYTFSP